MIEVFLRQQFQLQIAQRLAVRAQKLNAPLPQALFEHPDLHVLYLNLQSRPLQLAFEHCDARLGIENCHRGDDPYYAS